MCLSTQNKRAFITKKDLKTYKMLRYYIDDSNERVYRTLCKNYPIKLSSVMRPEPLGKDEYPFKEKGIYHEIGKGFIHSFIGQIFYPAIDFCKEYSTWGTKKGEVIPAWSKYFQGTDNNDKYCYASKKIMIE